MTKRNQLNDQAKYSLYDHLYVAWKEGLYEEKTLPEVAGLVTEAIGIVVTENNIKTCLTAGGLRMAYRGSEGKNGAKVGEEALKPLEKRVASLEARVAVLKGWWNTLITLWNQEHSTKIFDPSSSDLDHGRGEE